MVAVIVSSGAASPGDAETEIELALTLRVGD